MFALFFWVRKGKPFNTTTKSRHQFFIMHFTHWARSQVPLDKYIERYMEDQLRTVDSDDDYFFHDGSRSGPTSYAEAKKIWKSKNAAVKAAR